VTEIKFVVRVVPPGPARILIVKGDAKFVPVSVTEAVAPDMEPGEIDVRVGVAATVVPACVIVKSTATGLVN
jgi:hypothetical protein